MAAIDTLLKQWRAIGPARWAEQRFGWLMDGKPVVLLDWQRAVLNAWWARRESITTLAISSTKKTGKTTTNAVLTAWRWLCLPGEHLVAANDLDQSAGRQFRMISQMVERHPLLRDFTKGTKNELVFTPTGSTLTALAVDAAGNAGSNHLTASHTEMWGIIHEAGIRAVEELTPPPGRTHGLPALRVCDSYSGFVGESNTWHDLVDRGVAGELVSDGWPIFRDGGLLLFHITGQEAQERCFRGTPEAAATYYAEQRRALRPGTFARLHENQRGESETAFVPFEWWQACLDPELRPLAPTKAVALHVGVDAAVKPGGDDVAAIAVYYHNETGCVRVAWHRLWRGKSRKSEIRIDKTLEPFLLRQRELYHLQTVSYDPRFLTGLGHRLRDAGLPMGEVTQSLPVLGPLGLALHSRIQDKTLRYYQSADLDRLTAGAVAKEVSSGLHIKKGSSQKVDLLVALSFSLGEFRHMGGRPSAREMTEMQANLTRPSRWTTAPTTGSRWGKTRFTRMGRL